MVTIVQHTAPLTVDKQSSPSLPAYGFILPLALTTMTAYTHVSLRKRTKQEVCDSFLKNLVVRGDVDVEAPGFAEGIRRHFDSLPTRYALDVSIDGIDVLSHKRLLEEARADPTTVSFAVRPVEVVVPKHSRGNESPSSPVEVPGPGTVVYHLFRRLLTHPCPHKQAVRRQPSNRANLPKPAFGSSPNLQVSAAAACSLSLLTACTSQTAPVLPFSPAQALALEAGFERQDSLDAAGGHQLEQHASTSHFLLEEEHITFYEITIASADQPKLLSRLSEALVRLVSVCVSEPEPLLAAPQRLPTSLPPCLSPQSDVSLNIREAHAFNTSDGFSLDVFVVDQWQAPAVSTCCLGTHHFHEFLWQGVWGVCSASCS